MLWLLALVRLFMAFQFQSVAALSPLFQSEYGIGMGDIGLLIGLYLAPGILLAVPGGGIAARMGDKNMAMAGLLFMGLGGVAAAFSDAWQMQLVARFAAGSGGVLLNVATTKMVSDWFQGREIATAMGIYVNSWPVGIGLALIVIPFVASLGGLSLAMWWIAGLCFTALLLLLLFYAGPPQSGGAAPLAGRFPRGRVLYLVLLAGFIWGGYNVALSMVFSFGPDFLIEKGRSLAAASGLTSVMLWCMTLSIPAGGWLADLLGRRDLVIYLCFGVFAGLLAYAAMGIPGGALFALIGLASGIAAGPIKSLPGSALHDPAERALGMGLFFLVYYVVFVAGPIIAGALADQTGTAATAFVFGVGMLGLCAASLVAFRKLSAKPGRA